MGGRPALNLLALACATPLLVAGIHAQDALSTIEQRIANAVTDASLREAEALLERVVNINSGTMNLAGVKRVGDIFGAELAALGFKTTWIAGAAFKRAGHASRTATTTRETPTSRGADSPAGRCGFRARRRTLRSCSRKRLAPVRSTRRHAR